MSEKASSPWARFWGGTAGLSVIVVCSLLMVPLALFTSGALRIIFSLAFILFFPGYTLSSALFPAKGRLEGIERLALSFGLSLAVGPLLKLIVFNYFSSAMQTPPLTATCNSGLTLGRINRNERYV